MDKDGGLSHKLHGLDHLRAFAIIFVFLYHYGRLFPHPAWTNTISAFGWSGVDLFFVLSGYLIASQLFKNITQQTNISLKEFFIKRFFRIIPIYLFVVAVYFLFPFTHEREALAPLWKYLTFTQNINLDVQTQGTFSHAWSLCIEEQFYLLFPITIIALIRFKIFSKGFWLMIFFFLCGFAVRIYCYKNFVSVPGEEINWATWAEWLYYPTWSRLDGLLVGVSIAALLQFKPVFSKRILQHPYILFITGLLVFTATYFLCADETGLNASAFGFPLTDIGYGFIVLSALSPAGFLYKYELKLTSKIATLSYGIYLVHKIVIHITQNTLSKFEISSDNNLTFFISIAMVLIVSIILNEIIEKPFLKLRRRILMRRIK